MANDVTGDRLIVLCRVCGRTLGHIVNYGRPQGAEITLRCPCGGDSHPVRVAALYKSIPDGMLSESAFGPGLERAIETARRRNGRD